MGRFVSSLAAGLSTAAAVVSASPIKAGSGQIAARYLTNPPLTAAAPVFAAGAAEQSAKVLYMMSNQDTNTIVAQPVDADGNLSQQGTITPTGGKGGLSAPGPDTLGTQDCIVLSDNLIFAVNPGSNSLSMLSVDESDPLKLTLIGEPMYTQGDFPMALAISPSLHLACVANGGVVAGVSCARFDSKQGLTHFDPLRHWYLNQTNPPVGPLNGPGDILFSADESLLFATVKGNPSVPFDGSVVPGFVETWAVDKDAGIVSNVGVKTQPKGTFALFGTSLVPGTNNVFASEGKYGAVVMDMAALEDPLALTNITGQAATCWTGISALTGTGFVDDIGVSHIVEVDLTTGDIVADVDSKNGNQGMVDMQAVGDRLYVLTPGNGTAYPAAVTVFDLSGGRGTLKSIQNFHVDGLDIRSQGMAVMV